MKRAPLYMLSQVSAPSALRHDMPQGSNLGLRQVVCGVFVCWLLVAGNLASAAGGVKESVTSKQAYRLEFYQTLVGEMAASEGDGIGAYRFMIEAAKGSGDPRLFQRAVEIAVDAGSGLLAWQAATLWSSAQPQSIDAQHALLGVALATGREPGITASLTQILMLSPTQSRLELIRAMPATFERLPANADVDMVRVLSVALKSVMVDAATASAAYAAIGFVQVNEGLQLDALDSARQAQQVGADTDDAPRLALVLMAQGISEAEPLVLAHLSARPTSTHIRFGYARVLFSAHRTREARHQVQQVVSDDANFAPAWLLLGQLLFDHNNLQKAQEATLHALNIGRDAAASGVQASTTQALFLLAEIAQAKQDWQGASSWLDQIDDAQEAPAVLYKRAVLLGQQGFVKRGYALLDNMAQTTEQQQRTKQARQVQWLHEFNQVEQAYALVLQMNKRFPDDPDLLYEQAMLADKLSRPVDMERLLRRVMEVSPDYHHAYNALGYSFAERGERLPEAIALIEKALEYAPYDPYITDSLGWVYFRMGQLNKAEETLRKAYNIKADGEIAAHLGEVLWQKNQVGKAITLWREALSRQPESQALRNTMRRFDVAP